MTEKGDVSLLIETQTVLETNWHVARVSESGEDLNRELLLDALEERIFFLMGHNMERLLSSMYILDVAESRFKAAMAAPSMRARARALAEVVYDRETEKIESRRKYAGPAYGRIEEEDSD